MSSALGIKAIIAAVLVAAVSGAWLYVRHLSSENAILTANAAVLQGALDTERATRAELDRERVRADRLAADNLERAMQRAVANQPIRREIVNVPAPSQPLAACAPATSLVVQRLQQRAGSGEGGNPAPEAASKPAALRPGP